MYESRRDLQDADFAPVRTVEEGFPTRSKKTRRNPYEGTPIRVSGKLAAQIKESFGLRADTLAMRESSEVAEMGAKATTQGDAIRFAPGEFRPDTREGMEVLGHELNHVKEQASGNVPAPGGSVYLNAGQEAASDRVGEAFASGSLSAAAPVSMSGVSAEDSPVQGKGLFEFFKSLFRKKNKENSTSGDAKSNVVLPESDNGGGQESSEWLSSISGFGDAESNVVLPESDSGGGQEGSEWLNSISGFGDAESNVVLPESDSGGIEEESIDWLDGSAAYWDAESNVATMESDNDSVEPEGFKWLNDGSGSESETSNQKSDSGSGGTSEISNQEPDSGSGGTSETSDQEPDSESEISNQEPTERNIIKDIPDLVKRLKEGGQEELSSALYGLRVYLDKPVYYDKEKEKNKFSALEEKAFKRDLETHRNIIFAISSSGYLRARSAKDNNPDNPDIIEAAEIFTAIYKSLTRSLINVTESGRFDKPVWGDVFEYAAKGIEAIEIPEDDDLERTGAAMSDVVILKEGENRRFFKAFENVKDISDHNVIRKIADKPGIEKEVRDLFIFITTTPTSDNDILKTVQNNMAVLGTYMSEHKYRGVQNDISPTGLRNKAEELLPATKYAMFNHLSDDQVLAFYDICVDYSKAQTMKYHAGRSGIAVNENITLRNVATSRLAELLGVSDVVARSELATLKQGEEKMSGMVMEGAKGKPHSGLKAANKGQMPTDLKFSPDALRQITCLELLDSLCGQVDRHFNNIFTDVNDEKTITGVQGIDNDMAFGRMTLEQHEEQSVSHQRVDYRWQSEESKKEVKENLDSRTQEQKDWQKKRNFGSAEDEDYRIAGNPYIDKKMAQSILALTPEVVKDAFSGFLPVASITALWERILATQKIIRNTQMMMEQKGKDYMLDPEGWEKNQKKILARWLRQGRYKGPQDNEEKLAPKFSAVGQGFLMYSKSSLPKLLRVKDAQNHPLED